jgi:hypothetical protein
MFKNLKNFRLYSLICAIAFFISGGSLLLAVIGYSIVGIIAVFASNNFFLGLILFLFFAVFIGIYALFGVYIIYFGNLYLKRSEVSKKLELIEESEVHQQLEVLKDIERREFWIERLIYYATAYLGSIVMICTLIFAPFGILSILWLESQRKMDRAKDKFNFNANEIDIVTKRDNSNEIFKLIQKKVKYEAWATILLVIGIILSIVGFVLMFSLAYNTVQKDYKPNTIQKNTMPKYFDINE